MKLIILVLILLFSIPGCTLDKNEVRTTSDKLQPAPNLNPVKVLILKPTTFQKELISNGKLKARNKSILKFKAGGELEELSVKNGERIHAGRIIAKLNQEKFKQSLQQANLQMLKAELELKDILIGQGYQLEDSSRIPEGIFKTAKLRSSYTSAEYEVLNARTDLQNTVLYAPFSGVVANVNLKLFEQVSTSEEFCTLIDDSAFEVEFDILETEIQEVSLNKTVKVIPFIQEEDVFHGSVSEVNPVVNEYGLVRIKALVKNTAGLMEGMNVKVKIETAVPNMLVVPKSAVVLRQNQEVLFRYTQGTAHWTYVQTGHENSTSFTVTARPDKGGTLATADTVIISGNLNLAHGSEVIVE